MKRKIPEKVLDFMREMQPGDEVHFLKEDGKIGFKLMTAERNPATGEIFSGEWSTEFVQTGGYGYFYVENPALVR